MKKLFPILIIFFLIIIIKNNISGISSSLNKDISLSNLEKNLEEEKNKNKFLKEKLSIVKTNKFVEEEAREKLGLGKTGEYQVIAPTPAPLNREKIEIDEKPNWQRWMKLFF